MAAARLEDGGGAEAGRNVNNPRKIVSANYQSVSLVFVK